jgi:hypothetical protein
MTYDKAKYHLEGDFPSELPDEQAYLHEGMFLKWLCKNALLSDQFREDFQDEISRVERGELQCAPFFRLVGGVLADDMLAEEVIPFMDFYYGEQKRYYVDYASVFYDHSTLYHVNDNADNFQRMNECLDKRFLEWRTNHSL